MARIRLIHWSTDEAEERAERLRGLGYEVDSSRHIGSSMAPFRDNPPDVVVIDLSRLPSHGREVATALKGGKQTRHIPIVFVDGEPDKIAKVKAAVPDGEFASWRGVGGAISRAISRAEKGGAGGETQDGEGRRGAGAPRSSRSAAPASSSKQNANPDGYSGTPLVKKLGINEGSRVLLVGAPKDFEGTLGALPVEASLTRRAGKVGADVTLLFVTSRGEVETKGVRLGRELDGGVLWMCWPKKASGVKTDVTEDVLREVLLPVGIVDVKVCAIDATWSGLRFAKRKSGKAEKRKMKI